MVRFALNTNVRIIVQHPSFNRSAIAFKVFHSPIAFPLDIFAIQFCGCFIKAFSLCVYFSPFIEYKHNLARKTLAHYLLQQLNILRVR